MTNNYDFSADWFSQNIPVWGNLLEQLKPSKILEIGSYEGRSTCYLIENCSRFSPLDLYCLDTWQGGVEHDAEAMAQVEARFTRNVQAALQNAARRVEVVKIKGPSAVSLARLIAEGKTETFDWIYIDGSHQAPDVLSDAVLSFMLLKRGGVIVFDDYTWHMEPLGKQDLLNMPKLGIDAFTTVFQRRIRPLIGLPLYQVFCQKVE